MSARTTRALASDSLRLLKYSSIPEIPLWQTLDGLDICTCIINFFCIMLFARLAELNSRFDARL